MYCKPIILGPNGKVPVYKTKQAACADVYLPEDVTDIMFGEWHVYLGKQDKIQIIESEVWL